MKVGFSNFRCFKKVGPVQMGKITLLVGNNSSGKTSFMAGLRHLLQVGGANSAGLNDAPFDLGSFQQIIHRAKAGARQPQSFGYECESGDFSLRLEFGERDGVPSLMEMVTQNRSRQSEVEVNLRSGDVDISLPLSSVERKLAESFGIRVVKREQPNVYKLRRSPKKPIVSIEKNADVQSNSLRLLLARIESQVISLLLHDFGITFPAAGAHQSSIPSFSQHFGEKFLDELNLLRLDFESLSLLQPSALAPLRMEPQRAYFHGESGSQPSLNDSNTMTTLLSRSSGNGRKPTQSDKLLHEFGIESGLFKSVGMKRLQKNSPYPYSISIEDVNGGTSDIMDVGYGVSQILPVVADMLYSEGKRRFLLQQPEIHLHPQAQAAFTTMMVNLTALGHEFVVETHSDHILRRLRGEITQGNMKPDDATILFFDRERYPIALHQIALNGKGAPVDPPRSYRRFFIEEMDMVW